MNEQETKKDNQQIEQNMSIYNAVRKTPQEAKKPILEGRLKGKTDINPMWRIKVLTECFGPCGIGWKYVITRKWLENANEENIGAFVDIELYIKDSKTGNWSEPIPGTGGSVFKRVERSGNVYMDDECYKKATTDALSVACKALGVGADVYWDSDTTKYSTPGGAGGSGTSGASSQDKPKKTLTPQSVNWAQNVAKVAGSSDSPEKLKERITKVYNISDEDFKALLKAAGKAA